MQANAPEVADQVATPIEEKAKEIGDKAPEIGDQASDVSQLYRTCGS